MTLPLPLNLFRPNAPPGAARIMRAAAEKAKEKPARRENF
jgi:hypothetical protein